MKPGTETRTSETRNRNPNIGNPEPKPEHRKPGTETRTSETRNRNPSQKNGIYNFSISNKIFFIGIQMGNIINDVEKKLG